MKTLITLGCSLTPFHKNLPNSWANPLKDQLCPDKHVQFSFGGGGNQQLLDYLDRYMLENNLENTTIAYQITGITRGGGIYSDSILANNNEILHPQEKTEPGSNKGTWQEYDCYFGSKKTTLWCGDFETHKKQMQIHDPDILLTRIVSTLSMLSLAGANVFAFRGWAGALADDQERWFPGASAKIAHQRWAKCKKAFDRHGVDYIDECLVEWCKEMDLEFCDDWHPTGESSYMFADKFIVPRFT